MQPVLTTTVNVFLACRKSKGDDKFEILAKCGSSITIFLQVSATCPKARVSGPQ